ncbi:hypothetical protein HETIRDRAFT_165087 [Heterobasidion irregulare TC 32-1]|uniref:CHY-type domain-containing protein n=1 Tax=Heterobasidion irregulare (strain TC 32-1) TaxID=747525 RepID=W4JMI2_HETIT|nr:uncharacterized protein HETIRDRAFT_165087 [Heterobasidion irregulare TC 32-1]ETW74679.1 hypothetical protein HETIRDRAFT_165087 [Heterobasidion irregulare TC 32-1]
MCKHILNAQVSIRAPCCKRWFDCPECHAESESHPLARTMDMVFICKKCKKAFRKDMTVYEESDEYCPHCDNHYVRACSAYPVPLKFALGFARRRACDRSFSISTWQHSQRIKLIIFRALQVINAKSPQAMIGVEGEDARIDARLLKDDRVKGQSSKSLFVQDDSADRLG